MSIDQLKYLFMESRRTNYRYDLELGFRTDYKNRCQWQIPIVVLLGASLVVVIPDTILLTMILMIATLMLVVVLLCTPPFASKRRLPLP